MSAFRSWRWSALAVAFGFSVSAAQAEMITPDSIPNPPSAAGSANGTLVNANNIVTYQYNGLGLNIAGTAITHLDNIAVWAPLGISPTMFGTIDYTAPVAGLLVSPGSLTRTAVSSLTIDTFGLSGAPTLKVEGLNGQLLNIIPVLQNGNQLFGLQEWTFTGAGISWFSISPSKSQTEPWGVSGVSFTTATAPEPSSIVLGILGALGFASRFGWQRLRRQA